MMNRVWHGWTTPDNADAYEYLLKEEIFRTIDAMKVSGYRGITLLRRTLDNGEVEFVTIMQFESVEAVRQFAGADYRQAYVPEKARALLSRFDAQSQHYLVRHEHTA